MNLAIGVLAGVAALLASAPGAGTAARADVRPATAATTPARTAWNEVARDAHRHRPDRSPNGAAPADGGGSPASGSPPPSDDGGDSSSDGGSPGGTGGEA